MPSTIDFNTAITNALRDSLACGKSDMRLERKVKRRERGGCSCTGCGTPAWQGENCSFCGRRAPRGRVKSVAYVREGKRTVSTYASTPLLKQLQIEQEAQRQASNFFTIMNIPLSQMFGV